MSGGSRAVSGSWASNVACLPSAASGCPFVPPHLLPVLLRALGGLGRSRARLGSHLRLTALPGASDGVRSSAEIHANSGKRAG